MSYQVIKTKGKGSFKVYSEAFKKMVVAEFERGPLNKDQLQAKYGIGGNTRIFEWCKKYGKLHYPSQGKIGAPMKDPQKQRITFRGYALASSVIAWLCLFFSMLIPSSCSAMLISFS